MTTKRFHNCNFCHADIKDQDGIGLQWRGDVLFAQPMANVENHLCGTCCRALADVLKQLFQTQQAA